MCSSVSVVRQYTEVGSTRNVGNYLQTYTASPSGNTWILIRTHVRTSQLKFRRSLTVEREKCSWVGRRTTGARVLGIFPDLFHIQGNRRNVRDFGRVFLMSNYNDITPNIYIQSWTVTEIMAIEMCGLLGCRRTVRRTWRQTCPMRTPVETW